MDYQPGHCYIDYPTDQIIWNAINFTAHLKNSYYNVYGSQHLRPPMLHDTVIK